MKFTQISMAQLQTIPEIFEFFNWILLIHGLTGFMYKPNNRFIYIYGFVFLIFYWILNISQLLYYFIKDNKSTHHDLFAYYFDLHDHISWILTTFNLHYLSLVSGHKIQKLIMKMCSEDCYKLTRISFLKILNCIIFLVCLYSYIGIPFLEHFNPYFRWYYELFVTNGISLMLLYCYKVSIIFYQQIFMFIILFLIYKNLKAFKLNGNSIKIIESFDINLKLYRKVMELFGKAIVLNVYCFFIGMTTSIFFLVVEQNFTLAFNEYIIWYMGFFVSFVLIPLIHKLSSEVSYFC